MKFLNFPKFRKFTDFENLQERHKGRFVTISPVKVSGAGQDVPMPTRDKDVTKGVGLRAGRFLEPHFFCCYFSVINFSADILSALERMRPQSSEAKRRTQLRASLAILPQAGAREYARKPPRLLSGRRGLIRGSRFSPLSLRFGVRSIP